jgi:hypothetical protein
LLVKKMILDFSLKSKKNIHKWINPWKFLNFNHKFLNNTKLSTLGFPSMLPSYSLLSYLNEFNCPETFSLFLVTQQWIDKREQKNFLIMQKMLEKFMVYAMNKLHNNGNFSHL